MPVEMMHYTAFQSSVARLLITMPGGPLSLLDLSARPDIARSILPAPAIVDPRLPAVSAVRPRTIPAAGAVALVQAMTRSNIFAGQPPAFFTLMTTTAQAADAAVRACSA